MILINQKYLIIGMMAIRQLRKLEKHIKHLLMDKN